MNYGLFIVGGSLITPFRAKLLCMLVNFYRVKKKLLFFDDAAVIQLRGIIENKNSPVN